MTDARIYRPARTPVQSGRAKTHAWVVEPEPLSRSAADRLIGWLGSDDTRQQLWLKFPTKEAAIAYCERRGLSFSVTEPNERTVRPKSYAENFTRRP
jgi:hypothetical protein